jgi:hypothetical protein
MVKCLVYLISPVHAISAICAVKRLHGDAELSVAAVIHWPGVSDEMVVEIKDTIRNMARGLSVFESFTVVTQDQVDGAFSSLATRELALYLKNETGLDGFDEIYYPHDVVGQLYSYLCSSFPKAKRICYGDALGNVYEKEVHLSYINNLPEDDLRTPVLIKLKHLARRIIDGLRHDRNTYKNDESTDSIEEVCVVADCKPNVAALVLPVDQSGNFLEGVELEVCGRELLQKVVESCIDSTENLNRYIDGVLNEHNSKRKLLLLTENLAEGNFMDFDVEIDMWSSIVREAGNPGDIVFIKPHPGEVLARIDAIRKKLEPDFEVVELDAKFKRYPIEIWKSLLLNSTVLCMSYPVLSLKYLYDIDVIQPMDDEFIEKWFPERMWASYKNCRMLYMEPLKRLPEWDGKSMLWSGSNGRH